MEFIKNNANGWCPEEKQKKLYQYCKDKQLCLEIGVYGGSSLIPMAQAVSGYVIGIDPWSNEEAIKSMPPDDVANREWWIKVDLDLIKKKFLEDLDKYNVRNKVIVVESSSDKARHIVGKESIDVLHIDGNHTEIESCRDVELWCPKIKKGGYLFFDDTEWGSVQKALTLLPSYGLHLTEDHGGWRIYQRTSDVE